MVPTPQGMSKLVKDVQPEKAPSPIFVNLEDGDIITLDSDVQPANALGPINVTLFGISMDCRDVNPRKAPS